MFKDSTVLVIAVSLLAGLLAFGQAAPNTASTKSNTTNWAENVTTTVSDTDSTGAAFLTKSDGQGPYTTTYKSGKTIAINSAILSDGSWKLDLHNQSSTATLIRTLCTEGVGALAECEWQGVNAHSHCWDSSSGSLVPFQQLATYSETVNCGFGMNFTGSDGNNYTLVMGPNMPGPEGGQTDYAQVTCTKVNSSNLCTSWTIAPEGLPGYAGMANLFRSTTSGWVFVGQYYNSFLVKVTYI